MFKNIKERNAAFDAVRCGKARLGIGGALSIGLCYIRILATDEMIFFNTCEIPEDIYSLVVKELTAGMTDRQKHQFAIAAMNSVFKKEKSMEFEGCTFSSQSGLPFDFNNPPKNESIVFAVKSDAILKFTADGYRHVHKNFRLESDSLLPERDDYEFYGLPIAIFSPEQNEKTSVQQAEMAINGSSTTAVVEVGQEEHHDPSNPASWNILIADINPIDRSLLQKTIAQLWNFHASLSVQLESHLLERS